MANPEDLLLANFMLDLSSNQCGYPICCPGNQPKFVEVNFFPTSLTDMGIENDLREFFEESEKIFHETGMPMFPCVLHHFCLPFSPFCAMMYFANQRKSKLEELIKDFNKDKATPKGLYVKWNDDYYASYQSRPVRRGRAAILVPVLKPGLDVKMNIPKRQEYCAKNGIQFVPPIIQQNPGFPVTQQPPVMGSNPSPYNPGMPPTAPPPYGPPGPQGDAGVFYPPNYHTQGVQKAPYILPDQGEPPRQWTYDTNHIHGHHGHHGHHDTIHTGSNSSYIHGHDGHHGHHDTISIGSNSS